MQQLRGVAHVHSTYSFDGRLTLLDLAKFFRERGIHFVLMSEHVEGLTPESVRSFMTDCAKLSDQSFLLIPGIEIDALHALFYGVQAIEPWSSNEELASQLAAGGAMTVVSHPVKIRKGIPAITQAQVEGVEVWNSRHDGKTALDGRILKYWRRLRSELGRNVFPVCGIDFHSRNDFVPLVFELECDRLKRDSVLAAIRAGQYRISLSGKRVPLNFDTGELPAGYRFYSGLYRLLYRSAYAMHRAALGWGFKLPTELKAKLRKVF